VLIEGAEHSGTTGPRADGALALYAVDNVGGTWWAVGDDGVVLKWKKAARAPYLKRYSAGRKYVLRDVDFVTAKIGYAVGSVKPSYRGIVLKTVNGGKKWTRLRSRARLAGLGGVSFVSRSRGWAAGAVGQVVRTTNGTTWKGQRMGLSTTQLTDVCMLSARTGYVVGDFGTVLRTTNGGKKWVRRYVTIAELGTENDLHGVDFVSASRGWAGGSYPLGGSDYGGFIVGTTNGGRTWTLSDYAEDAITGIDFLNRNRGFACSVGDGVDAGLYESDDGGASWVLCDIDQGFPAALNDVRMSLRSGFAVGEGMRILRYGEGVWSVDRAPE
jgi:photosystem II stability/assembly factor-like uncharacterized protein